MNPECVDVSMDRNTPEPRPIRQLDEAAIQRIAAGEVVERPASVLKELVENALDAGATRIDIAYADGGKTLVRVTDDGHGIPQDQLELAVRNHATSKIDGSDLVNIADFGFRGEALAAMGAAGRLSLRSRSIGSAAAASITVEGSRTGPVEPVALSDGTVVELRDLFRALPARRKFLRSDTAEAREINATVKRLAMAAPGIGFTLRDISGPGASAGSATTGGPGRLRLRADRQPGPFAEALRERLRSLLGKDFVESAIPVEAAIDGYALSGYAALPTYSRGAAVAQFTFVNGRSVRDPLFLGAVRAAYSDLLSRDRYPAVVLFLDCDPERVDVNVHPTKAQVRFREPQAVRKLVVTGVRHALSGESHRTSDRIAQDFIATAGTAAQLGRRPASHATHHRNRPSQRALGAGFQLQGPAAGAETSPPGGPGATVPAAAGTSEAWTGPGPEPVDADRAVPMSDPDSTGPNADPFLPDAPLGAARAQFHDTYVMAQTRDGIVIVDQHAAHERLVYERFKAQLAAGGVRSQLLLLPEIIELDSGDRENILAIADDLSRLGLGVEPFGGSAVCVREAPAILGDIDVTSLVRDICDELAATGFSNAVGERIDRVLSRMSCHRSVRAGKSMSVAEMDALLREMEATPFSGQCNHGRPTHVELKLADIEKLFGRR